MGVLPDAFPSRKGRPMTIKHKERKKGQCEQPGETEEKRAKSGFLPWEGELAHPIA